MLDADVLVGGVSIEDIIAERDQRDAERDQRIAAYEQRFADIAALIDKALKGDDVRKSLTKARAMSLVRSSAGIASGKARANKRWHKAGRQVIKENRELDRSDLIHKIIVIVDPPVEQRTIERFVERELGTAK
jgi:hypothetical protein